MTVTHQLSANVDLLAGQIASGYARIEAVGVSDLGVITVIPAIRDTVDNVIFTGPQRVKLIGGLLIDTLEDPLRLPDSTGQPGMSPLEWSYRVTLLLDHLQPSQYPVYVFQLGADLDLADVVSVPPVTDAADAPWADSAAAAQAAADEAELFRDELAGMLDDTATRREGNRMDLTSRDFHPPTRPRDERFDGTSHPLSDYYATLAGAQVLYPFATTLDDETDWAAIQLAVLSVVSYPRQFGTELSDWRQYGTAVLSGPVGGWAKINRPITKLENTNQNFVVTSPAPWGFRLEYTGGDGGRMFDLQRDSVGSVLVIENMVLQNAGVRVWAAYRGLILIGSGLQVIDSPHPAVHFVDTPDPVGVGVVGPIVKNLYTHGCAGSVWQESTTATITLLQDFRFIANRDTPLRVNGTTDMIAERGDFTGMLLAPAAAGKPYVEVIAANGTTNNIDLRQIRCGSEDFGTAPYQYVAPQVPVVIGEVGGATVGTVRLRKVAFRTPAVVSASVGRAAVKMNVKCVLDVDECDFGEFEDYLIDETASVAATVNPSSALMSWWGHNTVDTGHAGPVFSHGGVGFLTAGRFPTVDQRAGIDPGDDANLLSTDLSTWTALNATIGAATAGGPNGVSYYPVTKTANGMDVFKTLTLTAGRRYVFGVMVRQHAGSPIRTFRMRAAIGTNIMVDQLKVRLDSEWVVYWLRIPYVETTGTCNIGFYLDNAEEGTAGAVVDVCLPFVSEGVTPRIPRTGLRLTTRRAAPASPVTGMIYTADGATWDPLARGLALPYAVFWNGSTYQAVSNADPVNTSKYLWELNAAGAAAAVVANTAAETPLFTATTMGATELVAGVTVLRVRIHGNFDNQAASNTFTLRLRANNALLFSQSIAPTQTNAATGTPWFVDVDVYVDTTGAGGAITALANVVRISNATGTAAPAVNQAVGVAVNLTTGLQLQAAAVMATASATNIMRALRATVQQVA